MNKTNLLKKRLKKGDLVLGTWCTIPSPTAVEVISAAGLDFVIIDMEHGPFSTETAENCVRAAEARNCTPIIRVAKNDEATILSALDIGAHGVVIPHIENAEDAKHAISNAKYAPIGKRGFTPYTRTGGYSRDNIESHAANENEETMTVLIVEGVEGMKNIDKIIDEKHIDVIYIGQYDLSQAVGKPGKVNDLRVLEFMKKNAKKIHSKGIAVGSLAHNLEEIRLLRDLGFQFITYFVDCAVLYYEFKDVVKEFKKLSD
ncbi:MAG: aldolase/citrate lyase family protein [Candidatus Altiarchaeota archaeon]